MKCLLSWSTALLVLLLLLAACGEDPTPAATIAPTPTPDPAVILQQAGQAMQALDSVHFDITRTGGPAGATSSEASSGCTRTGLQPSAAKPGRDQAGSCSRESKRSPSYRSLARTGPDPAVQVASLATVRRRPSAVVTSSWTSAARSVP